MDVTVRIGARTLIRGAGRGREPLEAKLSMGRATISFPYNRPSHSVLFIHAICVYMYVAKVSILDIYVYELKEEKILHGDRPILFGPCPSSTSIDPEPARSE
jgi:hypothetical protein